MPLPPKDPLIRQRRNVKTEAAELSATPPDIEIPQLPNPDNREWHALSISWWDGVWKSPMAARYLAADVQTLGMVAMLVDDFYKSQRTQERLVLAAEIRQQTARFGLSNWDRNRMNWTIAAPAEDKPVSQSRRRQTGDDPRNVLKFAK
jgi:hypothetical protein